ncbi:MAG: hypothetical protein ACFFAN_09585 [Promethearchaeota archaeon]
MYINDNDTHTPPASSNTIKFKCQDTTIYTVQVKAVDSSGKAGIGTFTINSVIDANGNGLDDIFEARLLETDESLTEFSDHDEDGLTDLFEMGISNTSYINPDTDGDGLWDGYNNATMVGELAFGTDPRLWSTDGDWLSDAFEVFGWNITDFAGNVIHVSSNPLVKDTEGDGLDDYYEYVAGTDPRNSDFDNDKLEDGIDPFPTKPDGDEDGLSDFEEYQLGTNPNATDTDNDGIEDGAEVKYGWGLGWLTNPLSSDSDHDFVSDSAELTTYKYEIDTKKQLKKPVSLKFEGNCKKAQAAQIAFAITFGEFNESAPNESGGTGYGIETVPDLEIEILKREENLKLYNFTSNGTAQRYISQVVDVKDVIDKMNLTEDFNYQGEYIVQINNTKTSALLEQFEIEASVYLDPNNPDCDSDSLLDGVETGYLVRAIDKIDFKESYWYNNLTVNEYNSNETISDEFWLEIPDIGRVYDADLTLQIATDQAPQGTYEESELGTIDIEIIKEEINCSIEDGTLLTITQNIYNNWTQQDAYDSIELELSEYLNNGTISEYYGSYRLKTQITKNEHYYANNTCNFTLGDFYVETDTWREPSSLSESGAWITDPSNRDTDGDTISDSDEINGWGAKNYKTNPTSADSDGDKIWDNEDIDPLRDLIVKIEFLYGKDYRVEKKHSHLQAEVKFALNNVSYSFYTKKVRTSEDKNKDGDYRTAVFQDHHDGYRYFVNFDDNLESVRFTFHLWNIKKDNLGYRILREFETYQFLDDNGNPNSYSESKYEDRGKGSKPHRAKIKVEFETIALERANTIAIYEANDTTWNGHYREKQKYVVIQLHVNDNNASTPFNQGPNAIIMPTALFTNCLLNGYIQRGEIDQTPLYSPREGEYEFTSGDRDDNAQADGSTNWVDFVVVRGNISSTDAMAVLDLLLTCVVNETVDNSTGELSIKTAQLYTYACGKYNGTSVNALSMNLPADVLEFVPMNSDYKNSEQGEEPVRLEEPEEESHEIKDPWLLLIPVAGVVLFYLKNKEAIDYYIGVALGLVMSFVEFVIKIVMTVIEFLVMLVLTFLMDFLWLIIRAILLVLIFILLAIEIISTVPLYYAIGASLGLINGLSDIDINYDVEWWAEYGKDTVIGLIEFKVMNIAISIESCINWIYWEYFDLWYPVPDIGFEMDDLFGDLVSYEAPEDGEQVSPSLHCGFEQVGDSSTYEFRTIYDDNNIDPPEYVKVKLISPSGSTYSYDMDIAENGDNSINWWEDQKVEDWKSYISNWENYEGENFEYDENNQEFDPSVWHIGVGYTATIDFEQEFTAQEREGQWFYYFEAKDDPSVGDGDIIKWPKNDEEYGFYNMPGPYFGSLNNFLYSSYSDIDWIPPTNEPNYVWYYEQVNFTIEGIRGSSDSDPNSVNIIFLLPDGSIETFDMGDPEVYEYDNPYVHGSLYGKTKNTYSKLINFSKDLDYEFTSNVRIGYYYKAQFDDGTCSQLWTPFHVVNCWQEINVKAFSSNGEPNILRELCYIDISRMIYDENTIESELWDQFDPDEDPSLPMMIYEEQILRFHVFVRDPDGTHEEIYDDTGKTITPELTFKNIEGDELDAIPLEWVGHDKEAGADEYFVDISASGYYSYEWTDDDTEEIEGFGSGTWLFRIEVEDTENSENFDTFDSTRKIWVFGSATDFWATFYGATSFDIADGKLLNNVGLGMDIVRLCTTLVAGGLAFYETTRNAARGLMIALVLGESILNFVDFIAFTSNKNTGALIGLALNSFASLLMYYLALNIASFTLKKPNINLLQKIPHVASVALLFLLMYNNPIFLLPALVYGFALAGGGSGTGKVMLITSILTTAMLLLGYGDMSWEDDRPTLPDLLSTASLSILTLFITTFGLGALLGVLNIWDKRGGLLKPTEPVQNAMITYTFLNFGIGMVALIMFLLKTQWFYIIPDVLIYGLKQEEIKE